MLKGVPAAPGIAYGSAFILDKQDFIVPPRAIMENEIPIEIARFEEALVKTKEEIAKIQQKISTEMQISQAQIFEAHLLVLEDRTLIEEVIKRIRKEKLSAEYIFSEVLKKYVKIFSNIEDDYLRERVSDVNDVGRRLLKNLMDETKMHEFDSITEELIIISHDLSPSDTASMYNKNIIAFATDIGGKTSHSTIMAKSLGIPAVVGLKDATLRIRNQDTLIVDGREGLIIIHPTEETKKHYIDLRSRILKFQDQFQSVKDLACETTDGKKINLLANLELPEEIPSIIKHGANGIGLYRTEFFYMNRVDLPSEEEQFEAYKQVAQAMAPNIVTIRSLDLGGDKFISSLQIPRDMYPFLGWRAIRFCLARPDIFKTQLRAILRASAFGNIRLMYPMIIGPDDLRRANAILYEVKTSLRDEKIPFNEDIKVGAMIEVPSAAVTADLLAKEADFFSIGTNDLIQYMLAVDRVSEQTAELYDPGHPSILRVIKNTIDAAHKANIPVGLCGEMSSEPSFALILLGMNIDDLSMSALSILQIKKLIRSVSFESAKKVAEEVLQLATGQEVDEISRMRLRELAPDVVTMKNDEKNG
ncbi:MAG: phosphoenolpyruvate--protein phosphotransferase [Candidatus Omnitrophica bacterium]|nr:phosphoenolpyruvate--protein phosphotransferase [Candidatus Omnitrophota bacterium]MCB9746828.1 phosphoenolpyruvate--protein phosphotransferase [Candidatus Omnitrophota bacterium]